MKNRSGNVPFKYDLKLEVTSGGSGQGQQRGGGVGGTNYWVSDRLKDVLYNVGDTANILQ